MEGGPDRNRSPILTDRSPDRGFHRAIAVSVAIHVLLVVGLYLSGSVQLRPDSPETYAAGLAGGLPAAMEAKLPDLGGAVPRIDPPKPKPQRPKPPERKAPPAASTLQRKKPDEPADVVLPAPATATPRVTPSASPRPTPSPSPEPTATPTPAPTAVTTASPAASPTPTQEPQPTATPTATPEPTEKPKPAATKKPGPKKKQPEKPKATAKPKPKPANPSPAEPAKEKAPSDAPSEPPADEAGVEAKAPAAPESAEDRDARIRAAMERVRIEAAMDRVRARVGADAASPSGSPATAGGGTASSGGAHVRGGGGTGTGGFGTGGGGTLRGADFLLYYNEMITRIRDAWVWVGGSANLEVEVGFRVTRAGDITGMRIVRPSGDPSYDQSVLRALRAVRNLGPPPERHRETFGDVQLTFRPADLERSP